MGDLVLKGATSGQITLTPTAVAGTNTLTVPAKTGNLITSADAGTITGSMIASSTVTPSNLSQPLTLVGNVTPAGATSYQLASSIPSWARRVTVAFANLTGGNSSTNPIIQVGTSGGLVSTGYTSIASYTAATSNVLSATNGFLLRAGGIAAGDSDHGALVLYNVSGNTWAAALSGAMTSGTAFTSTGGGYITLSGALTQLSLTSTGGAETFTAGFINVFYE